MCPRDWCLSFHAHHLQGLGTGDTGVLRTGRLGSRGCTLRSFVPVPTLALGASLRVWYSGHPCVVTTLAGHFGQGCHISLLYYYSDSSTYLG